MKYPELSGWVFPGEILKHLVKDAKLTSILDVGGGTGILNQEMWDRRVPHGKKFVLDIWKPCLVNRHLSSGWHKICGDGVHIPLKSNSVDMVQCTEVIEHVEKRQGWILLEELERVAKKAIFMTSPRGFKNQPAINGNPFQIHKCGWMPEDYRKAGFNVEGNPPPLAPGCQLIIWKEL